MLFIISIELFEIFVGILRLFEDTLLNLDFILLLILIPIMPLVLVVILLHRGAATWFCAKTALGRLFCVYGCFRNAIWLLVEITRSG